jgi:hypothetical protein
VLIAGGGVEEGKEKFLIQGNSTEMVSVLGVYIIGRCERKASYEHVSDFEWLPT